MADFTVVIVGAGLASLSLAIQCRRWGLRTLVLERAPEILEVGAGIQIPPNASRVLASYGILQHIQKLATEAEAIELKRYSDGSVLTRRPLGGLSLQHYGAPWLVVHRADYHGSLLHEAERLGAKIMLASEVVAVDVEKGLVTLKEGTIVSANAIVGADGTWSLVRDAILDNPPTLFETGDLAYRATFTLDQLKALRDPEIESLCQRRTVMVWLGPERHCVFYPMREGKEYNLVLLRPDDLPCDTKQMAGDLGEMRKSFEGWNNVITKLLSCIPSVLKWKLVNLRELETWHKGCAILIGDACHPTLPYQAQGAAMAVEDGAALGLILGLAHERLGGAVTKKQVEELLSLFENLRKARTTDIVQGAVHNRWFYHIPDGKEQQARDQALKAVDWQSPRASGYQWVCGDYNAWLLAHDVVEEARQKFEAWWLSGRSNANL